MHHLPVVRRGAVGVWCWLWSCSPLRLRPARVRSWTVVPSANQGTITNFLYDVSCTSAKTCTAVGFHTAAGADLTLIETRNGGNWKIVPSPSPGATWNFLYGVSCATAKSCMAVGTLRDVQRHQPEPRAVVERQSLVDRGRRQPRQVQQRVDRRVVRGRQLVRRGRELGVDHHGEDADARRVVERQDVVGRAEPEPDRSGHRSQPRVVSSPPGRAPRWDTTKTPGTSTQTLVESWNGRAWSIVPQPRQRSVRQRPHRCVVRLGHVVQGRRELHDGARRRVRDGRHQPVVRRVVERQGLDDCGKPESGHGPHRALERVVRLGEVVHGRRLVPEHRQQPATHARRVVERLGVEGRVEPQPQSRDRDRQLHRRHHRFGPQRACRASASRHATRSASTTTRAATTNHSSCGSDEVTVPTLPVYPALVTTGARTGRGDAEDHDHNGVSLARRRTAPSSVRDPIDELRAGVHSPAGRARAGRRRGRRGRQRADRGCDRAPRELGPVTGARVALRK